MDRSTETPPYYCALAGDELADRIDAWQRILHRAIDRRVDDRRTVTTYPKDGRLLEHLRELIRAEASCCSFLEFRVEEEADRIVLELRLPMQTPAAVATPILELMGGQGSTNVGA